MSLLVGTFQIVIILLLSLALLFTSWNIVFCVIRPLWITHIQKFKADQIRYMSPIYILSSLILLPTYFIHGALPEDPWVPLWLIGIAFFIDPFGIAWTPIWLLIAWQRGNSS